MTNSLRAFISYIILFAAIFSVAGVPLSAQDRAIHLNLRFPAGYTHTTLNKRIARGTSHVYHLRARKGQYMGVILDADENTSFTIYSTRTGQLDNADGVHDWDGALPETGEYIIEIGTDVSANYRLTVSIE